MLRKKHKAVLGKPRLLPGKIGSWASHQFQYSLSKDLQKKASHHSRIDQGKVLEALFTNLPVGVASFDKDFRYLQANPAYTSAAGFEPGGLDGRDHFRLFPDPALKEIFREALSSGNSHRARADALAFLQRPGQPGRYWDWNLQPLYTGGRHPRGLVLTIYEVTGHLATRAASAGQETTLAAAPAKAPATATEATAAASEAQSRLHQMQLMYQHLFESTPDSNIIVNEAGIIVAVNRRVENLFGYSREELAGQPVAILASEALREMQVVLRSGDRPDASLHPGETAQPRRIELDARRKDGSSFPTEITFNPVKVGGNLLVLCMVRDASQRVARERALHTQSDLVRLLQDIAVAANEADSVNGALQYALERLNRELGWQLGHALLMEEDGVLSSTPLWTGPAVIPGQIPATGEAVAVANDRHAVFKAVSEALRFRAGNGLPGAAIRSGQPVWLNHLPDNPAFSRQSEARQAGLQTGLAVPILAGKEVVGMLEFFHVEDVPPDLNLLAVLPHIGVQLGRVIERYRSEDALRKAAAQLHMVMTNLPVILWVIDREGQVLLIEGKEANTGDFLPKTLLGKNLFNHLDTRPDILNPIRRALGGEEVHTEIHSNSGTFFEIYLMPYFDVNWAVDGVIGLYLNISRRKRMEAELEEMKHRLLDSIDGERAKLAGQLHDGPLQDLFGAYYQIQEIKSSLSDHSLEVANNALQTIQGVNATLRVICGELHPNTLIHLGLQKAIRSHAERLQERLEGTIVHLDLDEKEQNLPYNLRLGLFRAYQQLFNNAVRHASAGDIWIKLRMEPEQILLEVQDNGVGFENPAHWIELVRQNKLGLVSTLERVQGLNGKLEIITSPGQGTLARISVPGA